MRLIVQEGQGRRLGDVHFIAAWGWGGALYG